jgi:hypothetical protein
MFNRLALIGLLAVLAGLATSGTAASSSSQATKAQAVAAGWDCSPNITILGYFHCAAPGSPSLLDLITGAATPPTLHLNVYDGDTQLLAGTEQLIRADLFRGQPCPEEGGSWSFLDFAGADYYGCHHFAA